MNVMPEPSVPALTSLGSGHGSRQFWTIGGVVLRLYVGGRERHKEYADGFGGAARAAAGGQAASGA